MVGGPDPDGCSNTGDRTGTQARPPSVVDQGAIVHRRFGERFARRSIHHSIRFSTARTVRLSLLAAAAGILLVAPSAAAATGSTGSTGSSGTLSKPLASKLAGPLRIAVGSHGDVYVAQSFAGVISRIHRGAIRTIATVPGVGGVEVVDGRVVYSTRVGQPGQPPSSAVLGRVGRGGITSVIADLLAFEQKANPDKGNSYGFRSISAECAAKLPAELGPARYTGQIDSNPFGLATRDGKIYVADAGANAVLEVSRRGTVRVVAVLPPQPAVVTQAAATELKLPACAVGLTYDFEPVPTDVEIAPDGSLYVTLLPGGPESASLGARGSVQRIDRHGRACKIAGGLLGATGLAIGPKGTIYVSEIFAGRVSRIVHGAPRAVVTLTTPSGLEYADGRLYVSYDVLGADGKVATIAVNHR